MNNTEKNSNSENRGPAIRIHPALLFFVCLGAGLAADWLTGFPKIVFPNQLNVIFFAILIGVSCSLGSWIFWIFRQHGTPVEPALPAAALVRTGPYRFSRNPMYTALILLFAAFAVLSGSIGLIILMPVLVISLHFGVVLPEENYLLNRFGDEYRDYCRNVRRWW